MATKYGMVIDLAKCVGCGTCAIACKTENNTRFEDTANGRKYNWADFYSKMEGTFPDTNFSVVPVLCNHCSDAPCITACPDSTKNAQGQKAMFKTDTGITMLDESRCIGCQLCIDSCPYSAKDVRTDNNQWSVLSYNPVGTGSQPFWDDTTAFIAGGTSTPKELATAAGTAPPSKNDYTHANYKAIRSAHKVEKCFLCEHRVLLGDKPYCVVSCPAEARTFGDKNDSQSEIAQLLASHKSMRLMNNSGEFLPEGEEGTGPNVHYINDYKSTTTRIGIVETIKTKKLHVYPNPARDYANIEFNLSKADSYTILIVDINGREVKKHVENGTLGGTQSIKVDVSEFATGPYFCTLETKGGVTMTGKFIVNR